MAPEGKNDARFSWTWQHLILQAQYNMRLEKPELSNTRASFSVSGGSKTPANQAYIDLLKAQWILHTIILREDNRSSLMTDENRKLFHTLSDVSLEHLNVGDLAHRGREYVRNSMNLSPLMNQVGKSISWSSNRIQMKVARSGQN